MTTTNNFFKALTTSIAFIGAYVSANIEESKLWNGTMFKENEKYIYIAIGERVIKILKKNIEVKNNYESSYEIEYTKANKEKYSMIIEL